MYELTSLNRIEMASEDPTRVGPGHGRVPREELEGVLAGAHQEPRVVRQVGHREARKTVLPDPQELAGPPELEVPLRDREPVVRVGEHLDALARLVGRAPPHHEDAVGPVRSAPDAAAELVELREPEPLGVLDDHRGRVRDVHPHLDHRGGDEHADRARLEPLHHRVLLVRPHAAVDEADLHAPEDLRPELLVHVGRGREFDLLGLLDERIDDEDLPALGELRLEEVVHLRRGRPRPGRP